MTKKRVLVICPATENSEHRFWREAHRSNFDLFLVYCGKIGQDISFRNDAQYYIETQGQFKLENINLAVQSLGSKIWEYDAVWLPDDDIRASAVEIRELFRLFFLYDIDAAQPAVKMDRGLLNHSLTGHNPRFILRRSNFIEMMAPIFKTKLFMETITPTLTLNRSGFGIDLLWSKLLKDRKVAIIDGASMWHKYSHEQGAQPATGQKWRSAYYENLESAHIDCFQEMEKICEEYAIDWGEIMDTPIETIPGRPWMERTYMRMILFIKWARRACRPRGVSNH